MKTNKLILGTVQFGLPYGINNTIGQITQKQAFEILDYASQQGISFIDTAAAYGNSETILGDYFSENKNHNFKVITKFSFKNSSNCEASMLESLSKLQIETLDTLMFHSFEDYEKNKSQVEGLIKKYGNQKFFNLGVSVYTNKEAENLLKDKNINTIQLPYNILDNASKRNIVFEKLKNAGKTIHTRSVFLQGLFLKDINTFPGSLTPLVEPINEIKKIAFENNISVSALALAYAKSNLYIDNVLIGVDSLEQLQQNSTFANISLSIETLNKLDTININNLDLLNPSKWKI